MTDGGHHDHLGYSDRGQPQSARRTADDPAAALPEMKNTPRERNTVKRFWSLVRRDRSGCEFLASLNDKRSRTRSRYFRLNGKTWIAARLVYTLRHGPIPAQLCVCHTCDNRWCLRDEHHFLGTQLDNIVDMVAKGRHRGVPGNKHVLGRRWKLRPEASVKSWRTRREKYGPSGRAA